MTGRTITIEDLLALRWISDPQVSPDGRRVVCVVTVVDREADTYRSHLWVVPADGGEMRQFTTGAHRDTLPRWSPDGRWIAFLSDRDAPAGGRRVRGLYVIPADGGEARLLVPPAYAPSEASWSPDGRLLACVGKPPHKEPASDVRVITRIRYKADGEGLWDGRYRHIFIVALAGGEPRQVTDGDYDHADPAWSPDGRHLAFVANRDPDADVTDVTDVWVVPADGGSPRRLTRSVGPCQFPSWSPDGTRIAYYGHDNAAMGATNIGLWVVPAAGGEPVHLTRHYDRSLGHHIITDMRAHPRIGGPAWTADGRRLVVLIADGGTTQIGEVDAATGSVRAVTAGRQEIYGLSVDPDRAAAVVAASDPLTPGDLWRVDLADGGMRRLTSVNHALLSELTLAEPLRFVCPGADGWPVEGWVLLPPGRQEGRHPTVLQVHGGPHGAYGEAFVHEFQVLAASGFAVVYTNPRGSQGYGQAVTAATRHDWGGKDYEDLMAALDAALQRFSSLDPDRLGVAGGSYGGYMTTWIIGHTDRFKAAVTMRSISNHLSQWGTSDLAYMKGFWEFPGDPWEAPTWYWERSPLAYVARITTPLLILHGEQDLRCPVGEAEQLFAALMKLRRRVVFVRFPDASHDLSRTGRPTHRVERLRWIVRWFTEHLAQPAPPAAVAAGESR
ncbi:MAG: S9 family peptidase [Armatimonadota bacterium]|nr:S9 family peptidase [Armatimonadota bacterium]